MLKDIGEVKEEDGAPHVENWHPLPEISAGWHLLSGRSHGTAQHVVVTVVTTIRAASFGALAKSTV